MIKLIDILKEIKINNPFPFNKDFVIKNLDEILDKLLPPSWGPKASFNHIINNEKYIIIHNGYDDAIYLTDQKPTPEEIRKYFGYRDIHKIIDIKNKRLYVIYT